jgi:putative transposase
MGRGGRSVTYPRRDIVDAIRYLNHNGGVWRALPADFPPWPTVYHYFNKWERDGTLSRMHNGLREQVRLAEGRQAEPSAAILDSQSVRAAETVAKASRGFDGGKKINGRKRHIAVDTCGLLLIVLVTGAGVQDRVVECCCGPSRPAFNVSEWSGSTAATVADRSRSVARWG